MLKKLLSIACFFILIGSARSQSLQLLNPSDTLRIDTSVSNVASHVIEIFDLKNGSTTDTLRMNWKVILNTFPHSASWSICDPNLCYASNQVGSTLRYTFTPQQQGIMKFDFIPNCTAQTNATFRVRTWASNDSAGTTKDLTWIYNVAAVCTNVGISEVEASRISLYPNPVIDEIHLTLPASYETGQIDIYNMIGSKVYSQSVSRDKTFDLSALQSGLYVARISEGGKLIATRKFTKAD